MVKTILSNNKSKLFYNLLYLIYFLFANGEFIISNLLAISFKLSVDSSSIFSPSNELTRVSNTSDIEISFWASGTDRPCSHFDTVCLTICNFILNSSCERPYLFSNFTFIFSLPRLGKLSI